MTEEENKLSPEKDFENDNSLLVPKVEVRKNKVSEEGLSETSIYTKVQSAPLEVVPKATVATIPTPVLKPSPTVASVPQFADKFKQQQEKTTKFNSLYNDYSD